MDDAVVFTARLASGALASFEATRYAAGRKNGLRIELNGSAGSLAFDLERLNELEFFDATTRRRLTGGIPPHPRHRARPSLPVRLVAAGAHPRLGAHVHAPGQGPADGDRGGRAARAVVRPTGWPCSGCLTRCSAVRRPAAGGRRSEARGAQPFGDVSE